MLLGGHAEVNAMVRSVDSAPQRPTHLARLARGAKSNACRGAASLICEIYFFYAPLDSWATMGARDTAA
jgi:hypothetical protein